MRSLPKAALALAAVVVAAAAVSACRGDPEPRATAAPSAVLRIGVGAFSTTSAISGVRQLTQIVTVEGLARLLPNGRVEPWLADRWTLSDDGRSLIVTLKSGATFHDGSPADAPSVVGVLGESLRNTLGPVAEDVESVRAVDSHSLEIQFKRPSPFLIEALEVQVKKPGKGTIATGPFFSTDASSTELAAHRGYYGGKPAIDTIRLQVFTSV